MKTVDFLFVYETKVREIENNCLIAYELMKRGYTVEFINTWYYIDKPKPKIKSKVIITNALRNDCIFDFLKSNTNGYVKKIINMQCEQIGKVIDEKNNTPVLKYEGMAVKQAANISWGENNRKRLTEECGIPADRVFITGQIGFDFCHPDFFGYFLSRDELFKQFNIPAEKHVCLFTSSFVFVNLPDNIVKDANNYSDNVFFQKISIESQDAVIKWIEEALIVNENLIFIYRPHPAEYENPKLIALQNKQPRFRIIDALSVKQWLIACDKSYTWYSTSIAEAYVCGKPCQVLRPVNIPSDIDNAIFQEAVFITDEKEFLDTIFDKGSISISEKTFNKYFAVDKIPSYIKIADVMVYVLKNKKFNIKDIRKKEYHPIRYIKQIIYNLLKKFIVSFKIKGKLFNKFYKINETDDYTKKIQKRNYAAPEEIADCIEKIHLLLEK